MPSTDVLDLPMFQPNDADAATVRDYLVSLLSALWEYQEDFSGKRPLGNSGWHWDLMYPLVKAGAISGTADENGGVDGCDLGAGNRLILDAIENLRSERVTP